MTVQKELKRIFINQFGAQGREDLHDAEVSSRALSNQLKHLVANFEPEHFENYSDALSKLKFSSDPTIHTDQRVSLKETLRTHPTTVSDYFDRIEASTYKNLIWTELNREEALAQEKEQISRTRNDDTKKPLQGIPVGIKDIFDVRDFKSSWGSKLRAKTLPANKDAELVTNLRSHGCIILGKLHTAELAMSPTGWNELYGQGINPNHPEYVSGGSSSGSAMAVAADQVELTYGSDTGGSVRLPSALCGLVGLKPTQNDISLKGTMPLSPSLDCPGPIAKNVDLCGVGYLAMKQQWPEQDEAYRLPWQGILPDHLDVAIPDLSGSGYVSPEVIDALKKAKSTIISTGITCHSVDGPDMSDLNTLANVVLSSECSSLFESNILNYPEMVGRQVRRRLIKGFYLGPTDYFDAIKVRTLFLRNFLESYLKSSRFLILPTTPEGPPSIKDANSGTPTEIEEKFGYLSYWTRGINYLGLPAISVPIHNTSSGLPLGLQIVGRPYDEYGILALAKIMESKIKRGNV